MRTNIYNEYRTKLRTITGPSMYFIGFLFCTALFDSYHQSWKYKNMFHTSWRYIHIPQTHYCHRVHILLSYVTCLYQQWAFGLRASISTSTWSSPSSSSPSSISTTSTCPSSSTSTAFSYSTCWWRPQSGVQCSPSGSLSLSPDPTTGRCSCRVSDH